MRYKSRRFILLATESLSTLGKASVRSIRALEWADKAIGISTTLGNSMRRLSVVLLSSFAGCAYTPGPTQASPPTAMKADPSPLPRPDMPAVMKAVPAPPPRPDMPAVMKAVPTPQPTPAEPTIPAGMPDPAICPEPPPAKPVGASKAASNAQPYRPFPATWQKTLDSFTANGSIPGAVIIVKSPDWGVRVGTTGVSNLVSRTPVSPDMQFRVGSVSKAFIAQAILRLEQEGKLKLTDHVLDYLGDNQLVAGIPDIEKITVANLLQMSSGISNYLGAPDIGYSPQVTPQRHFDPDELISVVSKSGPSGRTEACPQNLELERGQPPLLCPDFPPGQAYPNPYWFELFNAQPPAPAPYRMWYYSNSNYILLGRIAEKVTGLKAEEVLKRYVFDVAGLKDTYFATTAAKDLPAMHGYTKYGSIPYPNPVYTDWCDVTATNPTYAWTAGAVVSTPWDLLKFEDAMFAKDTLLNSGTKNKWLTFVSADIHFGWEPMQYGVGGLMQPERSYGTARGHGGAYPGYKALLYYFYDQQTSFVLATNTWDQEYEVNMLDEIMPLVSSAVTTPRAKRTASGTVRLAWQAGRVYGKSYNVYWGTDAAKVDRADESRHEGVGLVTVPGVEAEVNVAPGKTYYWRVDTVAPGEKLPLVNGPLWRFSTR